MADCFVVFPPLTSGDSIILGKNAQRPSSEVQEVIFCPHKTHEEGSNVLCTYIEVPQVKQTFAVILSKAAWMWGAEMGANDQGVSVANIPVWTKLNGPADLEEKLIGQDMTRLALERSSSAKEAVTVISGLLIKYGQGGPCTEEPGSKQWAHHNSFIIVDKQEGWILETAGKYWAAKLLKDGFYNVSSKLTIGSDFDLSCDEMKEKATEAGLYDPNDGAFNFSTVFSEEQGDQQEDKHNKTKMLLESLTEKGMFGLKEMLEILRDEKTGICMSGPFVTTGSMVSVMSQSLPACHWLTATVNPVISLYKPFIFCHGNDIGDLTLSPDFGDNDPAKKCPRFQEQVDRAHALYKGHKKFADILDKDSPQGHMIQENLKELEKNCVEDMSEVLVNFNEQSAMKVATIFSHMCSIELNFYKI